MAQPRSTRTSSMTAWNLMPPPLQPSTRLTRRRAFTSRASEQPAALAAIGGEVPLELAALGGEVLPEAAAEGVHRGGGVVGAEDAEVPQGMAALRPAAAAAAPP
eukprot:10703153-Lingulodinium_polyedra.AAC.1